jgi:hypothetical protein
MSYETDVPAIAAFARASADNMGEVCMFVVLSIREPFERMRTHMRDMRAHGARSRTLWGFKAQSYEYVQAHKDAIFAAFQSMERDGTATAETVTRLFTQIPGLGIVKAGFVAQMLGFDVACFDSRNMHKLGFGPNDRPFRALKAKAGAMVKAEAVAKYVQATRVHGGARYWWNAWCEEQSARLGYDTSRAHREIICGVFAS